MTILRTRAGRIGRPVHREPLVVPAPQPRPAPPVEPKAPTRPDREPAPA